MQDSHVKTFKADAKFIIDSMYDNKLFVDSLTRDDLNLMEDFISESMRTKYESHKMCSELLKKVTRVN